MIFETNLINAGFKAKNIGGKRDILSVFLLDLKDGRSYELLISDNIKTGRKSLDIELRNSIRKEITAIVDIDNDSKRQNTNYVTIRIVGIKK